MLVILAGLLLGLYQNNRQTNQIQRNSQEICIAVRNETGYWQHLRGNITKEISHTNDMGLLTHDEHLRNILNVVISREQQLGC